MQQSVHIMQNIQVWKCNVYSFQYLTLSKTCANTQQLHDCIVDWDLIGEIIAQSG